MLLRKVWGLIFMPLFSERSEWSMSTQGGRMLPPAVHILRHRQGSLPPGSCVIWRLKKELLILLRLRAPKASSFWRDGPVAKSHTEVK